MQALILALAILLPRENPERLAAILRDVSDVAKEAPLPNINHNDALTLYASIIYSESRYRRDVEACETAGDQGRAVGLSQIIRSNWQGHKRAEICRNRKLQLRLGWRIVRLCAARNPDERAILRCYTSGSPNKETHSSRAHWRNLQRIKELSHE